MYETIRASESGTCRRCGEPFAAGALVRVSGRPGDDWHLSKECPQGKKRLRREARQAAASGHVPPAPVPVPRKCRESVRVPQVAALEGMAALGKSARSHAVTAEDAPPVELLDPDSLLSPDEVNAEWNAEQVPASTVLKSRWVMARKTHECAGCSGSINPNEEYHSRSYVVAGELYHEKRCGACVDPRESGRRATVSVNG